MQVTTLKSGTEIVKSLPTQEIVKLEKIEGWEEIEPKQQLFISVYFEKFPSKNASCLEIGIAPSTLRKWLTDPAFINVFNFIKDLHTEALASVQYHEAYENSKIRAQVLKSLNAEGYEDKTKNIIHNKAVFPGIKTMSDIVKKDSSS